MANILLIDTNTTPFNEAFPVYPIGLDYLQGAIAQAGRGDCQILDLTRLGGALPPANLARRGALSRQLISNALSARPWDVVALSLRNIDSTYPILEGQEGLHYYLPELLSYLDTVAANLAPQVPVILGGTGFSIMPQAFLAGRPATWHGVLGPGETAVVALLRDLAAGKTPPRLLRGEAAGLGSLGNAGLLGSYLDLPVGESTFGLRSKVGCGQACGYCPYPLINGPRQELKAPEAVAAEVGLLAGIHAGHAGRPPLRFMFADDIFNRPLAHAKEVLKAMLAAGHVPASWHAYLDPGNLDEEFLELALASRGWRNSPPDGQGPGFMFFPFDIESGSDRMLKTLRKPYDSAALLAGVELYRQVTQRAVARGELAGAAFGFHLLLGYPGEDEESVRQTCRLINQARPSQIALQLGVRVYPGTPLAKAVQGQLWQREEDLHRPVFVAADQERIMGWMRQYLHDDYDRLARRGNMLLIGRDDD
ncbi:MAG: hypothetical protein V1806_02770 [Pseudomonadota bacterium]